MANMSYCRFENTYSDLADCVGALENMSDIEELSESEKRNARGLFYLCEEYIEAYNDIYGGEE